IEDQCSSAKTSVEVGGASAEERIPTNTRVSGPGGKAVKRVVPFCCGEVRIPSIRCRTDCLRCWRKRDRNKHECSESKIHDSRYCFHLFSFLLLFARMCWSYLIYRSMLSIIQCCARHRLADLKLRVRFLNLRSLFSHRRSKSRDRVFQCLDPFVFF